MRFLLLLMPGLWRDLRDAMRFLTRLPIPGASGGRDIQRAFGAFPLAGALIGVSLVALDWTLARLHLPPLGRDVLLVATLALLTGGTHLEGLMAAGDRLLAPRVPEAPRFAYPRDDAANPFGVVAVLCVLLLKVAALSALQGTARLEALIAAPLLGRWVLVLVASLFPPPDLEAVGIRSAAPLASLTAAGVTLLGAGSLGPAGIASLAICSIAAWRATPPLLARLPEAAGAVYDALVELAEVTTLLIFAIGVTGLVS